MNIIYITYIILFFKLFYETIISFFKYIKYYNII